MEGQLAEPLPKKGRSKQGSTLAALSGAHIDDLGSLRDAITKLRAAMKTAVDHLNFDLAAQLRDRAR